MTCFWWFVAFVGGYALLGIISAVAGRKSAEERWARRKIECREALRKEREKRKKRKSSKSDLRGTIAVRCIDDNFKPESGGETLRLKRISISGVVVVPKPNQRARIRVALTDVTSKTGDPLPVFCMIPDLCDEEGLYRIDLPTTIPHWVSHVGDMVLGVIPLFALVCPAKGTRWLELTVVIVDAMDPGIVFTSGTTTFGFRQEVLGYMEIQKRTVAQERRIVSLAMAVSASDGFMDRNEATAVRQFFAKRYAGLDDTDVRKAKVTEALQETLAALEGGSEQPSEIIARLCQELAEDGDEVVAQTAYELCVQVVAADKSFDTNEGEALTYIAEHLDLPHDFVQETRDRILIGVDAGNVTDEQFMDIPPDLSSDEKREFLNQEYRKWRGLVTHKDPAIAEEAALRIKRIRKLRRKLNDDVG